MQRLNQRFNTTDRSYVMPRMGETIGQMDGIEGLYYPRQGTLHCMVFQGKGDDDQHYSWEYDVVKQEIIDKVYMHPNNPGGKKR